MNTNASLLVNSGNGTSQIVLLSSEKPVKIKIQPNTKYLLKNSSDNFAPENVTLQRNGDDLYVILEGDTSPAIVIEDYYVSGDNVPLLGMAEDGQVYAYVITDGSGLGDGYLFNDGGFAPVALGGMPMGDGTYLFENTETNDFGLLALWPWFLGAAVLGGVIGNAIYEHNKDDKSTPSPQPASEPELSGATDMTGDVTGSITYGSTTDETKPIIYGAGEAGNIITIYDNGTVIGSVVVGSDGNWSFMPETALTDGSHTITITQTNTEGQTSSQSDDFTFIVDTVAPNKPLFEVLDDVGGSTGVIANGATTDDARPEFTGKGEVGSTITIFIDGKEAGKTTIRDDGTWSWMPTNDLADGHYQITITETDKAGNTSVTSPTFDFDIDTSAPDKPPRLEAYDDVGGKTGLINNGDVTDDTRPEFKGWGEAGNTIIIYDNSDSTSRSGGKEIGRVIVGEDGTWSFTPDFDLSDGNHSITYIQEDKVGNVSAPSDSRDFIIDTISPAKPDVGSVIDNTGDKTGPINPGDKTDETKPEFNGKGEPGSTITITDNGEVIGTAVVDENGNWTFTPEEELGEGNHSIVITETDEAGNSSEPSESIDFVVDTTPPSKPDLGSVTDNAGGITGPIKPGGATDDTTPTFTGEGEPGNTITIKDGDKVIGTVIVDENGAWSYTPETELGEGSHNIIVTETDEAGNTSEPSDGFEFIVDTTAPNSANLSISGVMDNYGEITGNITNGGATDDSRPVISGTGTAGDTIILYVNDGTGNHEIGRGTVGSDGKWSIQPETPLLPGSNQFTAVEMDPAGNKTDPSNQYTVTLDVSRPSEPVIVNVLDNVGDVVGPLQKGDVTDDNKPTITGTAEAGYTIRIYDGATLLGTATADSKGVWTFTPDTALADGKHNITATATSPVGQTSDKTGIFNFEVDSKAPESVQNLTVKDNVGDYQGPLKDGDTTDDNTPTFSGKAEAGSTVTIYADGKVLGTAKVDGEGKWTFTPDSALADGVYNFTTTVTDKAGNINPDGPGLTLTVDTSTHPVSIVALIDDVGTVTGNISANGATDDTKPEIAGQGKPGATIKVYDGSTLLGETTVKANGSWSFTPSTDLKEGAHSITVTMTDKAGNLTGPTAAFDFTIDTTAPNMPTIDSAFDDVGSKQGSLASGSMTDDSTPTLKGTAEKGSLVTIYDGSKVLGSVTANSITGEWGFTPSTPISEGEHKFHVTATDAAGNVSQPSADFLLTTDYTGPNSNSLSITGVDDRVGAYTGNVKAGETTDDTRPTISGTGTAGDTIIVYVKDGSGEREIGRATVDGNGKWSLQPASPLAKGANEFTAVEMDPVGNTTDPSAPYAIVIDNSRPLPPVIEMVEDNVGTITGALQKGEVTDDNKPTISGTAVANGIVTIYNNNTVIGSAQVDSKGNWTFTPNTALADGKYNITVTATSPVGQVSEPTGNWNFEIDTAAPSAAENLLISDNVGSKQGALKDGDVTDDATPTFSGKAEAGSTVSIYSDGNLLGTAKVAADGSWSFTPSSSLPDGDYKFTTTVTDKAGNTGAATPVVNIKVDTSGQEVSLDKLVDNVGEITGNISPNGVTDDTRPEITGTGKPGSIIKVYDGATLLGSTTVNADKSWSFTPPSDLGQGKHSITVTATDLSGNTTEPSSAFEFTIDTVTPTQPTIESAKDDVGAIQGNLNNGGATDDPTPTLTGKAEKGSIVKVYDGDALLGSVVADDTTGQWTFTPTSPLGEGEHKFHVTSTDKAGNTSLPSADFVLNMDFTGPDADALKITEVIDNVGKVTGNIKPGDPTDDNRPTIKGEGTAGDTIFVYVKDDLGERLLGIATVGGDGKWSLRPDVALTTGKNEFTAVEMDPVGNKVGPSDGYNILLAGNPPQPPAIDRVEDNVGPTAGALQKGDVTDDATPTLRGTAAANGTVTIYNNGNVLGTAKVDDKGNWSFTPEPALADGKYNITADVTNTVGQTSEKTGIFDFSVDTTAPAMAENLLISDNVGSKQGALKDGDVTDDATPTFSGKAEAGSTVSIYSDGNLLGTAKVAGDGSWSFTPSSSLPDGDYKFTTTVTDKAGNTGAATPVVNIKVDTSGQEVSLDKLVDNVGEITGNISPNSVTDDTRPEIVGTGKPGSSIKVYDGATLLGSTTVNADKSWSFTPPSDLGQGKHSITVTATDLSGNTTEPSSAFEFTVDTAAPSAPTIESAKDDVGTVQGNLNNGGATDDPTPTLTGKAEKGSIVKVYDGDTLLGSVVADDTTGQWTFTPTSPLVEGEHKFHVTSTDKAGNTSLPSADFVLNMDFTAPDADALKITEVIDNVGKVTGNIKPGDTTDDNRPTIKGEGTAGDTIFVYVKDDLGERLLGTATVGGDGKWSLRPDVALTTGKNEFTAVEMDPVGNKVGPSDGYNILLAGNPPQPPAIDRVEDNVGPTTGALQKGDVTDDATPTLRGTAAANGTVTIYNNGNVLGTAKVDDKGNWSFTPEPALVDGKYNITADVTNTVGQTSEKTGIFDFSVDTTAPAMAENLLISDNVGSKQGALKDGDVTDDATPTFSGKAEAGSTVSIYSDGNLLGTAKVAGDGSWSFTPSSSLPDGDYKFTSTVTDKAGNTGAATPVVNIKVDTSGQEVSLDKVVDNVGEITGNISPNGVTDDTRPEIVGTGKPGSIIKVYDGATLLGSTTVNADKSWSFTPPSDLGQGKHSITVTATDLSGNTTEPSSAFEFTIDTVTPTQPTIESAKDDVGTVQGNLNNGGATDDPTPTLTGKAEKGSTVKVYDGDTLLGSVVADDTTGQWTFTPTSPLVEGEHKFHVTSTDKAGNTSLPSADFVLNMDFTGPDPDALKITGVDDQVGAVTGNVKDGSFTDDSRPTINGTGTAGNTIYVYVSHESGANVLLGTTTVQSNGTWSLRPVNTLAEGSNKFTAKERDPVGNEVGPSNSYTVTLDGTPAVVPTLEKVIDDVGIVTGELKSGDVTDDTKPTFVGSASADCVIRVYDGSTLLGSTTADSSGKWSFESPTALKDGTHNITFTATSPIGQVSDPSDVFVLEVDTKVPSPVESLIITDNAGAYQGELKHGDTTDDSTPTFSGKAEAGSTVTIYNNGVAIGSTTVSAGGTWLFTPNTDLPDGNYKFTTTVTDKAGNVGDPSSVVNIIIDTSTLSVAIEKLIDDVGAVTGNIQANGITDDLRPEIVGTSSKPGSIITVYIDGVNQGTTTVKADGSWSFTPTTDLGQGTHTVTVTAKDLSGNVTPMSPEFSFTIDNVAPSAPTIDKALDNAGDITGDLKTGDYTDDNTPTLSGTAEKGSIVTIYDENDKVLGSVLVNEQGKWSYELPSQADGRHDYYVIASDIAGNKSNPTSDFTLNIDTQGPAGENLKLLNVLDNVGNITGNLVSGSGTDDSRPEFKGTANEVGNTVIIYATDGSGITREVGRTTVDVNREWSHELANALADGNYKFTVVEMDAAGNKTVPTPEFELLIDTTIPTATATISNMTDDVGPITGNLPSGSYTDDSTPRLNGFITGTLGANDKVVIYEKGTNGVLTALGEATMLDNTRWQFDIPPGSLVGGNTHNYVAAVTNRVGTISTPSADFAMTSIVEINSDTTLDTTPIISGRIPYTLELGSHMTVTVNGKTYSSLTGAVVVDTVNLTWYVQIPDSDALTADRTYDVDVRIVSSLGGTTDKTVNELAIAPTPEVIIDAGGTDGNNKATTFGMNNKGGWQIFSNQVVLDSNATSNSTIGQFNKTILTPNTGGAGYGNDNMNMVQNATFVDFNRDGHMDILGVDSRYSNGQQMFINNGDGTYTAKQMDGLANTYSWYGGVAAIDLKGDGYVDFLVGDQTPDDANAVAGTNSQIVMNEGGVFAKDTWYTNTTANGGTGTYNSTFGKSLSGIDLNNDGAVDIVFHGEAGYSKIGPADGSYSINSSNSYRLVVATNSGDGKVNTTQIIEGLFFNYWSDPSVANAASMTWADYNGDGYMDLFQGSNAGGYNIADARNSRIYFNDGAGKLNMVDPNNDGIGTAVDSGYYQFNDNMLGGASVAVDWNGDGKMDVIEAPMIGYNNLNDVNIGGSINLYTNTTSGSSVNFSTTYLQTKSGSTEFGLDSANRLNFKGSISAAGVVTNNPVTGMLSVDLDYDGAKDLLVFTSKGQTTYVKNNTVIADGTSLHLRIVDEQGVTIFYGNTVQLIDSTGKVVATQVINLQSGNQVNDSTSVVDFYGLNPNETYSVVLLRNVNGASQDVGSVSQVGTNAIENVNLGWGNIKAGAANEALILTAESGSNSANTVGSGVVGTGYNDTFIATQGTKVYEGGGGTTEMSSYQTWTETGGMDIVDFKLAGNTNLTINMMNKGSQYTGWNTITMKNIEGIAGGAGNDTFTDDKGDNVFEGRAGNDTFNLVNGGRDTLLYKPQSGSTGDNRGGNGSDVVNGFALGAREATPNADRIDVSEMLTGYTFGGGAKWINGVATMEVGETIANYLRVEVSGSDTLIYIDRDGNGSAYGFELLLTLKDVQTDLVTLLANHQLEVDNGSTVKMSATTSEFQAITQMFTAGNDIMFGTEQEDILLGGLGNDTFIGISKDDQVKGGDGNDTIKVISTDFSSISGDAGIDTLVLDTKGDLFDLSALKDKLNSIEIFDMGNGHNTMNVSLEDVLRLGSEELAINSGNKAIVVNGEAGSTLQLEGADGQWTMSQSNYQYQGNTYNVWTMGTSGVEVLVENTVNPVIL